MARPKKVEETPNDPSAALELIIGTIQKQMGQSAIMRFTNEEDLPQLDWVSTGSIRLDKKLGKGIALGRLVEIIGDESSGKTTLTLTILKEAQKTYPDKVVAFVDMEHALDVNYAKQIGVDVSKMLISQPDSAEDALNVVEQLVRTGACSVVVVDSIAALVPKVEIEGDMGAQHMGIQARLMGQACRKLVPLAESTNTAILWINQIRHKIGVMFGNPEVTSGGNAMKFYASQRLMLRKDNQSKQEENGEVKSIDTKIKVIKNKLAPPFRETSFTIEFGKGIDWAKDLVEAATEEGVIVKSGAWYAYKGNNIGQGVSNTSIYLRENPEVVEEIKTQLFPE